METKQSQTSPAARENIMGTMEINPLLVKLSVPMMISMLVQALYNVVDSVFVSHVSESALTAVSLAFSLQNVMIAVGVGTGVGVNALLSKSLGEKNQHRANVTAENGIFLSLCSFVVFLVIGLTCMKPYFYAQTSDAAIAQQGIQYLSVCCIFSLGLFTQTMGEKLLAATGRTQLSMISQLVGAVVNIILDPIFIFALNMGVTGAAVATIIGQFCGCALAIYFNHKKNTDITLSIKGFCPDFRLIGEIYAIGLPSVIMIAIGSVMTFLMNKILITYHAAHETAATAFGAYFKLNSFIFMPVFGMNNGVVPIVAYNYGARNRKRMVETIKRGALYASIIMVFGTVLFWVIPGPLLKIFDATDTMLSVGIPALRIISISFCMAGACIALGASFQALGRSLYSMITSIVRQLVFLIPIAYVLARYGASVGNSDLVWWSYPIAEVFSLTLTLFFFRHLYKTVIAQLPEGRE